MAYSVAFLLVILVDYMALKVVTWLRYLIVDLSSVLAKSWRFSVNACDFTVPLLNTVKFLTM